MPRLINRPFASSRKIGAVLLLLACLFSPTPARAADPPTNNPPRRVTPLPRPPHPSGLRPLQHQRRELIHRRPGPSRGQAHILTRDAGR